MHAVLSTNQAPSRPLIIMTFPLFTWSSAIKAIVLPEIPQLQNYWK